MKAGKLPPRLDARTFKLLDFLAYAPIPEHCDWSDAVRKYGPLGSETAANSTCVAAHHIAQTWTANTEQNSYNPVARDALLTYSRITGYSRKTGEQDDGAAALDALKWWRRHGLSTGHRIEAFALLDADDICQSVSQAIHRFGGAYVGLALPAFVVDKPQWSLEDSPGGAAAKPYSFGGQAVMAAGYDDQGVMAIVCGRRTPVSWAFLEKYCDEAYAVMDDFWMSHDARIPGGLDIDKLKNALKTTATPRLRRAA